MGGVTSVTASFPLASTGGATPNLSIAPATDLAAGSLSAADKTKLDGITPGAAVASVTGTLPILSSGGTTPTISSPGSATIVQWAIGTATTHSVANLPAGAVVTRVTVFITASFSGGATLQVGIAGTPALLLGLGVVDLTQPPGTVYDVDPINVAWPSLAAALATIGGAPALGACTVRVTYSPPNP